MNIVEIFNKVRDLPYHCPASLTDKDYRCWSKNRILFNELKKLGFEVRYRVCEFTWEEQRIPREITSKAPDKLGKHLYLEIKIDNKWIILDCSNDSKLPSFNNWDGKSDCDIAVKYTKIHSPEESIKVEQNERINFKKHLKQYKEFYILINQFFDKIRKR